MELRADVRESESYAAGEMAPEYADSPELSSARARPQKSFAALRGLGSFGLLEPRSTASSDAQLNRLRELGWSVEARECYRLARLAHRQILLFDDGRIIFKDPTIRGRHQYDGEWLKVSAFIWPDVGF
jgi:hypothetical protein